jgi:uncharacterized protein YdhG (YjbR/CyaY superfamily)
MIADKPKTIDEYIAAFPKEIQEKLEEIRSAIKKAAPKAEETINYAMPTFTLYGNLVHFAAFKNHIGFYATPTGNDAFKKELSVYKVGKGSIQFPFEQPLPLSLIAKIVKFRVNQNTEKEKLKVSKKKKK